MQTLILFAVFFGTVFLVLGVFAFTNRRRLAAVSALRQRIDGGTAVGPDLSILRDIRKSSVPFLDRLLSGSTVTSPIERSIAQAGVKWSAGEFTLASAVLASIGLFAGQQLGPLLSLLLATIGLLLPALLLLWLRRKRLKDFERQLPDAIDMVVNAMRAGYSFQAAMKFVGEEMPAPVGTEFTKFYDEQRLGLDVRAALLEMQERVGTLDVKMFVTSLLIQRETGGNLAEILTGLATLIRDRAALYDEIDTLTAEPKFTGAVLAALPVIAFLFLMVLNRPMMDPLFTTDTGKWVLLYAFGSVAVGYLIVRRIANIDL